MSTNTSSSDQNHNKNSVRPGTRERLAQGEIVRPWAKAVDVQQEPSIAMTEAEVKALEAQLGRSIDV